MCAILEKFIEGLVPMPDSVHLESPQKRPQRLLRDIGCFNCRAQGYEDRVIGFSGETGNEFLFPIIKIPQAFRTGEDPFVGKVISRSRKGIDARYKPALCAGNKK